MGVSRSLSRSPGPAPGFSFSDTHSNGDSGSAGCGYLGIRKQETRQPLGGIQQFAEARDAPGNHRLGAHNKAGLLDHGVERFQILPVHVWHAFTIAGGPAERKFPSRDFRTLPGCWGIPKSVY